MPKVDADPRSRDVADAGRDAASPANADSKHVKPAESTVEDEIPPVHVLEAAEEQERKETEELLSGFDRSGRDRKPVSKGRDFVDYYAKKKGAGSESESGHAKSGAPPAAAPLRTKQSDVATVLVPRKRERPPSWLAWAGIVALMLVIGGFVAYLATSDAAPKATTTAPRAAATITAALSPSEANGANNLIPPPDPIDPVDPATAPSAVNAGASGAAGAVGSTAGGGTATGASNASATQPARGAAKRERREAPTAAGPETTLHGTNATGSKPPPRDDFIRDL
jgi:hypothetical protein